MPCCFELSHEDNFFTSPILPALRITHTHTQIKKQNHKTSNFLNGISVNMQVLKLDQIIKYATQTKYARYLVTMDTAEFVLFAIQKTLKHFLCEFSIL